MTENMVRKHEQFCGNCDSWRHGSLLGVDEIGVCIEGRCPDYGHLTANWHPCACEVAAEPESELDEEVVHPEGGRAGEPADVGQQVGHVGHGRSVAQRHVALVAQREVTVVVPEPAYAASYPICDFVREHVCDGGMTVESELEAQAAKDWENNDPGSYDRFYEMCDVDVKINLEQGDFEVVFWPGEVEYDLDEGKHVAFVLDEPEPPEQDPLDIEEPLHTVRYNIRDYITENRGSPRMTILRDIIAHAELDWAGVDPESFEKWAHRSRPEVRIDTETGGSFEIAFWKEDEG